MEVARQVPEWVERIGVAGAVLLIVLLGLGWLGFWSLKNIVRPSVQRRDQRWADHLTKVEGFMERSTLVLEQLRAHEEQEKPVLEAIRQTSAAHLEIAEEWRRDGVRRADVQSSQSRESRT